MNDENKLIARTLYGDMDSFDQIIGLYENQLYKFVFKLAHSKEDTEDICRTFL